MTSFYWGKRDSCFYRKHPYLLVKISVDKEKDNFSLKEDSFIS